MKSLMQGGAGRTGWRGAAAALAAAFVVPVVVALGVLTLIASGGGGGGGDDVEPPPPPPGGTGTGAAGIPVFWSIYEWNADAGSALALRQTADGGFVAAGYQYTGFDFATPPDFFIQKTNSLGARQWMRRVPWPGGGFAYDVRPTADGRYIVAGSGGGGGSTTIVLIQLEADGSVAAGWPKTYGLTGAESANAVLPINGGSDGYLVAGTSEAGPLYVLRLDAAGAVLWQKSDYASFCAGGGRGSSAAMTRTADGNLVIAGRTGCFAWAGFLLKIAASNGNELWRRIFDDANASAYTDLTGVLETADGSLVAVGKTGSDCGGVVSGTCDALVIKTDSAGTELWRRRYGGTGKDGASGVALAADGSYLVSGYSHSYGGTIQEPAASYLWMDTMLVKIAPDGATVWHKIKGQRPRGSDSAEAIVATADGGFAIAGQSGGDVMLAKFDANGDTVNLGALYELSITVPATQGVVHFGNAVDVAGTGADGLILPRQVGGALLDRLIAASGGAAPSTYCTSGTYAFTPTVPATLAAGGSYALAFTDCVIGEAGTEQLRINGSATLVVDSVSGTPSSGTYDMQLTVRDLVLSTATVGTPLSQTYGGGLRLVRSASGASLAETVSAAPGLTLAVSEASGGTPSSAASYGPFSVRSSGSPGGASSVGMAGDVMTAVAGGQTFAISVLQPIVLAAPSGQPTAGSYRLSATDNSRLTVTIGAGTGGESSATLAIDTNGDGADDGNLSVPWDLVF